MKNLVKIVVPMLLIFLAGFIAYLQYKEWLICVIAAVICYVHPIENSILGSSVTSIGMKRKKG